MIADTQTIDRIVAEVLRRLRDASAPTSAPAAAAKSVVAKSVVAGPDRRCLVIDQRVVTLSVVAGGLDGVRRLSVSQQAVITPSVRDELRKRGITVELRDDTASSPAAESRVSVVLVSQCDKVRRAAERLMRGGAAMELIEEDPLQAAEQLAERLLDPHRIIVLFTDQVPLLVCRANRSAHVRAVAAHRAGDVRQGVEQLEANLWVVNPRWVQPEQWRRMWPLLAADLPRPSRSAGAGR